VIEKPVGKVYERSQAEIIHRSENHIMMSGQYNEKQRQLQDPPLSEILCMQKDGTYRDTGKYKPYGEFENTNALFIGIRQVISHGAVLDLETQAQLADI